MTYLIVTASREHAGVKITKQEYATRGEADFAFAELALDPNVLSAELSDPDDAVICEYDGA
jgi:hypothetical protein